MPEFEPYEDQLDGDEVLQLNGECGYGIDTQARRQSVSGTQMSADFVIVTTQLNRHGNAHRLTETKDGQGMKTDRHQRNPLVLMQHGMIPLAFPQIGAAVDENGNYTVTKNRQRATSTVYFEQANPDANFIFGMVEGGKVFQMASIGFAAHKGRQLKIQASEDMLPDGVMSFMPQGRQGILFTETQLTEWSIVDDGADPGAFRQYAEAGQVNGCKPTDRFNYYLQSYARNLKPAWFGWTPESEEVAKRIEQAGVTIQGKAEDVATFLQHFQPAEEAVLHRQDDNTDYTAAYGKCPECGAGVQGYSRTFIAKNTPKWATCQNGHDVNGEDLVKPGSVPIEEQSSSGVDASENPGSVTPSMTPEIDLDALVDGVNQKLSEPSFEQRFGESLFTALNQKIEQEFDGLNQKIGELMDRQKLASGSVD